MASIITKLYKGGFNHSERSEQLLQHLKHSKEALFEAYTDFFSKVPPELQEDARRLIDGYLEIMPEELEQAFCDGFSLGVCLMTEVFAPSLSSELDPVRVETDGT